MSVGAGLDSIPKPIKPGSEMAALARFHTDVTWTGRIQAGGMGPGTPAMTAVGWGKWGSPDFSEDCLPGAGR